jgi:HK97 family phage major capsid protein
VLATDMPDIGGSAKPIAFGDFSRAYTIVDRVNLSVMRDPYSQATSGNIRYVARRRVGGTVVLPEAIRLQNISA